ncbi:hypothetical protein V5799_032092 [Amblyomma americanum]|uniref:BTB domain-containing protein n=1 Tax=Amblyomma americanum TaxID=6943 RepID=A0AAQ4DS58_AMBAM
MDSASLLQFAPDCTARCKSSAHADLVLASITKGTVPEIQTYCRYLCHNFWSVTDPIGRTALQLASSLGKVELVRWLLEQCHADVDARDRESGWTALHRAVFYGQLHCAKVLLQHGANIGTFDFEGLTPVDLAVRDRLPYIEYAPSDPCEVYVWGSNKNFTLGLASEQSPKDPEVLESFRRDGISVQKVEMQKFHSVFLTNAGDVYVCGHGLGGRLGLNSEKTTLSVTQLPLSKVAKGRCTDIASGQDHTVLLMEDGQVLTCGLNTYHQLGLIPPPPQVLSPRPISIKFLKEKKAVGVCAAKYHSVIYTEDGIYTFGLNAGQLGHPKGDRLQTTPRQISTLSHPDIRFSHVVSSDGAVVCATTRGDIYVCQEYKCRKIASKQLEIKQLCVVGGQIDDSVESVGGGEGEKHSLKVAMLTKSGKVYLWQSSSLALTRCLFNTHLQPTIVDICLSLRNMVLVSKSGEGYLGTLVPKKDAKKVPESSPQSKKTALPPSTNACSLVKLLEWKECEHVNLKRLHSVNRATKITCSCGGESFAVLQSNPKVGLLYEPNVTYSEFQSHMMQLLESADCGDAVHDIVVKVKGNSYPLHRYVLASRSEYFQKVASEVEPSGVHVIENVTVKAFEEVLCFIYTNSCNILESDSMRVVVGLSNKYSLGKRITTAFLKEVQDACKKLGVQSLRDCLSKASVKNNSVTLGTVPPITKYRFFRNKFETLCDVTLVSSDKVSFPCHRCILVARLEYFNSMLSFGWAEFSSSQLSLPITSKVLEVILEFLYTDDVSRLKHSRDIEFLCQVLVCADQLLATRLKQMCEATLGDLMTLKNVSDLLEVACMYNADQLKTLCVQFMCINLPAVLECSLDSLSDDAAEDLASCYKEMIPAMSRRVITPYMSGPSKTDIERIQEDYGPLFDHAEFTVTNTPDTRSKARRKSTPRKTSESSAPVGLPALSTKPVEEAPVPLSGSGDCAKEPASAAAKQSVLPKQCQRLSSEGSVPIKAPERKARTYSEGAASPPPVSSFTFPSLKEVMAEKDGPKSPKDCKHAEAVRPMVKLSQKQRKQMKSTTPMNILAPKTPPPSNNCPWFQNTSQAVQASSPPSTGLNEAVVHNSFPSTSSPPAEVPRMIDILRFEEQKVQNLEKVKPKSLHVINMEDKAIEELLKFYNAEDNPEERITACRVLPEAYAAPVWKKHH